MLDIARRHFFRDCGYGVGKAALASLLCGAPGAYASGSPASGAPDPLAPKKPHFAGKARAVIHLFMAGAPSQLELFDYKPELAKLEGKPLPPEVVKGQRYAFIRPDAGVLGPRFKFARHGQCGAELSEMLPNLARVVDDICILKAVHTDQFNHAPAQIFFNSGFGQPGRPSIGSWVVYGLGCETKELPADDLHRHALSQSGRPDHQRVFTSGVRRGTRKGHARSRGRPEQEAPGRGR
jgi:hypothetical protein